MNCNNPDIYHTRLSQGVALAWVNSYSAAVVKTPGATLLFDPVSMEVPEDVPLDLIAISHSHSDHWDPQLVVRLQQRTQAMVATSPFLANRLNGAPVPVKESSSNPAAVNADQAGIPLYSSLQRVGNEDLGSRETTGQPNSDQVMSVQPGDKLKIGDVTITALRCDHPAVDPLAFLVQTADGVTVYLPGDTTPYPEMGDLVDQGPHPRSLSLKEKEGRQARVRVDILLWMGTAFYDGARIAQLVRPKLFLSYAIAPPAAGVRAKNILTQYTPDLPFHALERHEVFLYPRSASL